MIIQCEGRWHYHILIATLIVVLVQNFKNFENGDESIILNTTLGVIRGVSTKDNYNMFLGVPYAIVNKENPFGESLPHPKYEGVLDASDDSGLCPQIQEKNNLFGGSLDCLLLNIYVPKSASHKNLLPILVWFPGGKFKFGYAGRYIYGPKFLMKHDIIVISVSFRLGPYGFFCLNTPEVPGNQGLKDQITALRWIKKNIREFGGDSNKVTIAGSSSSAFGVDLLLRSDVEELFNNVIIQSGTIEYGGVMVHENRDILFNLTSKLGFNTSNVMDALNFLAKIEPKSVIETNHDYVFGPCVEQQFDNVYNLIVKHPEDTEIFKAKNISILIGNTKNELLCFKNKLDINKESIEMSINEKLSGIFDLAENRSKLIDTIFNFYMETNETKSHYRDKLTDFNSDIVFYYPTQRFLRKYFRNGGTDAYHYIFSYVGDRNFMRNILSMKGDEAATHADELGYIFDVSYMKPPTVDDQIVIDRITTLWANFVKYGNPTPETTKLLPVKWLPFNNENSYYLEISSEVELKTNVYEKRMAFWDLVYEKYGQFVKR